MSNAINSNFNLNQIGLPPVRRNANGFQGLAVIERSEVARNVRIERASAVVTTLMSEAQHLGDRIERFGDEIRRVEDEIQQNNDDMEECIKGMNNYYAKMDDWCARVEAQGKAIEAQGKAIEDFGKALDAQEEAIEAQLKAIDSQNNKIRALLKEVEKYEASLKAKAPKQPLVQALTQQVLLDDKVFQVSEDSQHAKEADDMLRKDQDARYEYDMRVRKEYDEMFAKRMKELQDRIDYLGKEIQEIWSGRSRSKSYFYNPRTSYAFEAYKSISGLVMKRYL